jgi:hypothetical protein
MLGALAGSAHVRLSADVGGLRRDMHAAEREFLGSLRRMELGSRSAGIQIARGLGFALLGSIGPMFLLGKAVRASMAELAAMRRETAQTEAVLESTGGVANVTARDIERLAEAGLRLSGVDDQLIHRAANVLLTFTRIRNEVGAGNDIFNQATQAVLDMSVALGLDMQRSAIQVGRALQDPLYGISALRRVGVNFTVEQKKLIERLMESGRVLEAQKFILAELRTEFGGSARQAGQEFPAALARAREAAVGLGAAYLETLTPALQDAAAWLERQLESFADNEQSQKEFRDTVLQVADVLVDLGRGANEVAQALGGWASTIKLLILLKLGSVILGWTSAMRGYTRATWGAVAATSALAIASGGVVISPRTGAPIPVPAPGRLGRLGRGLITRAGGLLPSAGAVAVATGIVLSQVPGGSGTRERDRRSRMRALVDGEYTSEFPHLTWVATELAHGRHVDRELVRIFQTLGQATEADMARVERRLRATWNRRPRPPAVTAPRLSDEHERRPREGRPRLPKLPEPKTELSVRTEMALAEASRTESDADDLRALERARRELIRMLKQRDLTEKERLKITRDLAAIENQMRSIEEDRRREAERAADEAKRAAEERRRRAEEERKNAHDQRVFELERAIDRALETRGVQDDLRKLIALRDYYRRWLAQQKKGTEDWREARADLDDVNERIKAIRTSERERRRRIKEWRLERAVRLAEETDGVQDDLRALRRLRAHLLAVRREQERYSEEWMETQDRIDDINRRIREARRQARDRDSGMFERFQGELERLLSQFAPNFFPASGDGLPERAGGVTIVQQFPTAPTDYFREARWAQAAARAVFDG